MTTTSPDARELSAVKRALLAQRLSGAMGRTATDIPVRPAGAAVPLSPVQHGLWVVDQFLADNALYSVHRDLWLRGPLDLAALRGSLDELVRRHEILRTTYAGDTAPVQVIGPPRPAEFTLTDLADLPSAERHARAVDLAGEELRRPFDLATGPLFRACLLRLDDEEHRLLLNMHHVVSDGWSCAVLGRELAALYSAAVRGTDAALPVLPIQYADYAHWQAERLAGGVRERQLDHWRTALGAVRPVLRLPTDRPYPVAPSYRVDSVGQGLGPELTTAIRELAKASGVTVFAVLLAAFGAVLGTCSGQDSLAVGTLTSGRDRAECEHLLGVFANTVAVPQDLTGDPTFADLLVRTKHAVLGALGNADVSFDDVVTALAPVREAGRNPLFQVLFQLIEFEEERWELPGLDVEQGDAHNDLGKLELSLFAVTGADELDLQLEYAVDLFLPETARRFLDRVRAVLERVVADPLVRLADLDVLSAAERNLVLRQWNDTALDVPRATLGALFEDAVARDPGATAVVAVDGSVTTYAELNAAANRLAHHLRALGVGCESVVGVCVESGVDTLVALLGVVKSGGAYVPLDPEHPADRLAFMLADTGAATVVTQRPLLDRLGEFDGTLVLLDRDRDAVNDRPVENPAPVNTEDNLVYVMYTSGSTGRPKGVMISHHGLVNYLWWAIEGYGLDGASGAPMLGSIAVDLSVPNFFLPLIGGKDVTLLPADRSLSALAGVLSAPGDFSLLKLTPGHLDVLRGTLGATDRVDSVRTYVVGADEVRPETVVAWRELAPGARIIDEYGPTETVVGCSTYLIDESFDPSVPVSIGKPIGNTRMYVLDESLRPLPVGAVGELCIGGFGVARGYWRRPGLTAEKFVPEPYGEPGDRMYRTGDLARFRADGNLEFLGRIDHQVKIRGYRVELGEIEARLLLHPQVSEAVVMARQDQPGHKRLAGYLVPNPGATPDPAQVREFLAAALPEHMVPVTVTVLAALPLTQAGKVDRAALPAPELTGSAATVAPRTEVERVLAEIWARVLGVDAVGVHDDFFELGGDSILSIQIAARARQSGLPVTVRQVFEHRSVAALAAVARQDTAIAVHAEQGVVVGEVPLTPILHWFTEEHGALDHYNQSVLLECAAPTEPGVLAEALTAGPHPPRRAAPAPGARGRPVARHDRPGHRGRPAARGGRRRSVRRPVRRDRRAGSGRAVRVGRAAGPRGAVHRRRARPVAAGRAPHRRGHRVVADPARRPRHRLHPARPGRTGPAAREDDLVPALGAPAHRRRRPRRARPRSVDRAADRPRHRPGHRGRHRVGGPRAAPCRDRGAAAAGARRVPDRDHRPAAHRARRDAHRVGGRAGAGRHRGARPRTAVRRRGPGPHDRLVHHPAPGGAAVRRRLGHADQGGQGAAPVRATPRHRVRSGTQPWRGGTRRPGLLQLPRPGRPRRRGWPLPPAARRARLRPGPAGRSPAPA